MKGNNLLNEIVTANVSIVLAADSHNPTILNPDFLQLNSIVPSHWEVKETITTPAFSQVVYDNGFLWSVDPNRCLVQQDMKRQPNEQYYLHDIIAKYVDTLPHVRYQAIGLNTLLLAAMSDPSGWIKENILNYKGPTKTTYKLRSASVKLTFGVETENENCNLELSEEKGKQTDMPNLAMSFNLHVPGPFDTVEVIRQILNSWPSKQSEMLALAESILEE